MPKSRPTKPGAERSRFKPDRILSFNVDKTGGELLEFLRRAMPDQKRTTVKDFLKHRQVMVNNSVTTQWDFALQPGDIVRVNTSREFQVFSHHRLQIVYEDDDIIVVNKGYGLLSIGTDSKSTGTAYWILRDYLKRKDPRNKLFIVHRLDQHTSGLMMFAKSPQVKEAMQHNWNNMVISRKYVALVEGIVEQDEGEIRSMLEENSAFKVYSSKEGTGKMAVTRYKVLRRFQGNTLVEFELDTGRKNQIRVHASDMGHPIVGDVKYGGHVSRLHRLALHAQTLRFAHPRTRRDMHFVSDIPW